MKEFEKILREYREEAIKYLEKNVPELNKLKNSHLLSNWKIKRIGDLGDLLVLEYDVNAPYLFPHVRKNLIDTGLIKKHNYLDTSIENEGNLDKIYKIHIGFYGSSLQLFLNIRR